MVLPRSFYDRPTVAVARDLLGKILVHRSPQGTASGRITEVEAYLPRKDPGSHAAFGRTPRNEVMFGPAGRAYVYFCYGNHFLFNIVTEKEGLAGAVLIRALEPVLGRNLMARRRGKPGVSSQGLTDGPGKLTQALGIHRDHNRVPVWKAPLFLQAGPRKEPVGVTTRIGITRGSELPLRFYLKGNPHLSVPAGRDRPSPGKRRLPAKRLHGKPKGAPDEG
jgi:DNA-3-methyladenine glycosylase